MDEFKSRIPDLAQSLRDHIGEAHQKNTKFRDAFAAFMTLCRASLNPEFTKRNVIAAQVQNVIDTLASASFSTALEWVIDQYQVKGESDPNREDDPGYIVRLVGQVVRVSVATAEIVRSLPDYC